MKTLGTGFVLCLALVAPAALAQQHVVYPAAGQDSDQQATDEAQCIVWAREESGVDPLAAGQPVDVDDPAFSDSISRLGETLGRQLGGRQAAVG